MVKNLQISEDTAVDDRSSETGKKKLITTKFVDWCCKHFSQPIMKTVDEIDVESSSYFEREWRYILTVVSLFV